MIQKRLLKNMENPVAAVISQTMQEPLKREAPGHEQKAGLKKRAKMDELDQLIYVQGSGTVCSEKSTQSQDSGKRRAANVYGPGMELRNGKRIRKEPDTEERNLNKYMDVMHMYHSSLIQGRQGQ